MRVQPPTLAGSWIRARAGCIQTKRATYRLVAGVGSGLIYTHADCSCNEVLALRNRHQVGGPVVNVPVVRRLNSVLEQFDMPSCQRKTRREVCDHYDGTKKKELEEAMETLGGQPLEIKDGNVRMFLKDDKYPCVDGFSDLKAPRCIQYRTRRFVLELARYLQPVEKAVYEWVNGQGQRVIAKARNSHQRAADLLESASGYPEPAYVLLDHSKFDAHVGCELLAVEHGVYNQCYGSKYLARMLSWQMRNRGITKNGTKYLTVGTRMSGDVNTGLGNSILNVAMLTDWHEQAGVKASVYVDGDDSVVVCAGHDVNRLLSHGGGIEAWFKQYGMETKWSMTREWEDVEFCQCKPVFDGFAWRMIRNPERMMNRIAWTTKNRDVNMYPRLVKSIGLCELACNEGMPIGQALAVSLINAGEGKFWKGVDNYYRAKQEAYGPLRAAEREVRSVTRESYFRAWGVTPQQQITLEKQFKVCINHCTQQDWADYWAQFG